MPGRASTFGDEPSLLTRRTAMRLLPALLLLAAWAQKMDSPPPAEFLGGVAPIAPGGRNELALSLPPGHYVMLCFLPDAKDHDPHIAHGMVHEFTIR